jgi:hypothetical protein
VKDPEEVSSPQPPGPFNPYTSGSDFVLVSAIAVILNAVKDPEEVFSPQPLGPFNP